MLTNQSQGIGKGGQGFAIPSRLPNRKGLLTQQLMGKNGDEGKQAQQGRRGAQDRQIRPLTLGLDPQMVPHFMKGDFDRPTQDKPLHDLGSLRLVIGARASPWAHTCLRDHG